MAKEKQKKGRVTDRPVILTVDPGLSGTGVAIWDAELFDQGLGYPLYTHSWGRKGATPYYKLFSDLLDEYQPERVYCEGQAYMPRGAGLICAKSGALVKLSNFAGAIEGICYAHGCDFVRVMVANWKGNRSKDKIKAMIRTKWADVTCTNHDWDAVGIGFYAKSAMGRARYTKKASD